MQKIFTYNKKNFSHGFTLLEMLIVISVLAILSVSGIGYYRNYAKNIAIDATRDEMIFTLKEARAKSALGDAGAGDVSLAWGVHLINATEDYYELYATPTTYSDGAMSVKRTISLDTGVVFTDPTEGATKDILFQKITGSTTPATISFFSDGRVVTVNITGLGVIY